MIGRSISAALPMFRAHAESLMTDSCVIERETSTWVEAAQEHVTTWAKVHPDLPSLPCHVEVAPQSSRVQVTGQDVTPETPLVKVPWNTAGVEPDDRVTIAGDSAPVWVTHVTQDDPTHPVELLLQCRRSQ